MAASEANRDAAGRLYIAIGALFGALYVAFDLVAEARLASGTLTGMLAQSHAVVDHLLPIASGALLGLCVYQLRWRKRLHVAEEAAARADALRVRLSRVERDQAVWILAASVLHEMNNPLHALGLLLDEQAACDDDRDRRIELNQRARSQLNRILSPLAALRTLRTGGDPDVRELSLDALVRSVATELTALSAVDNVRIDVDSKLPLRASADANYVRTILENLLDNSLQAVASKRSGHVSIRLYEEAGSAIVEVEDDGAELPSEMRPVLFDPLRSTKTNGLGLGLPIARALARAMQGDLKLVPRAKKTFRLELPREVSA